MQSSGLSYTRTRQVSQEKDVKCSDTERAIQLVLFSAYPDKILRKIVFESEAGTG